MALRDIITPEYLRAHYLAGLDWTDSLGVALSSSMLEGALDSAVELIESDLGLNLGNQKTHVERIDSVDWDPWTANLKTLINRPVQSITEFAYQLGAFPPAALPVSWIFPRDKLSGQVQLMPSPEAFSVAVAGISLASLWGRMREYTPGWNKITYVSGYAGGATQLVSDLVLTPYTPITGTITVDLDRPSGSSSTTVTIVGTTAAGAVTQALTFGAAKTRVTSQNVWLTVTTVTLANPGTATFWTTQCSDGPPKIFLDLVGMTASLVPLVAAGDLILGAGISSQSTSLDGVSTTVSTTKSGQTTAFSARIKHYQEQVATIKASITRKYRSVEVFAI